MIQTIFNKPDNINDIIFLDDSNVLADDILSLSTINFLSDVNIESVADNHFLIYDNSTSKWLNKTPADAITSLGVTATAAELNYLDITTLGTSEASKALTVDASGDLIVPDGDKFQFGSGLDMTLYHDGTNSYITNATGILKIATENSGNVEIGHSTSQVSIGDDLAVAGNAVISGNLTVNGTTTTVNSEVTTLDDPIITLGGDTAPSSDDNKDRGVEFRWHNGSSAKVGFFGYDDSLSKFTFIPDAINSSEVFSGTAGDVAFGAGEFIDHLTLKNAKSLKLSELDSNGSHTVSIKAPDSVTADIILVLPDGAGTNGQALVTDGSGNLSWSNVSSEVTTTDITGQTETTSISDDDLVLIYDTSETELRKITKANFVSGLSNVNIAANNITSGNAEVNINTTSGNIILDAQGNNTDIIFKGTDDNADITMLTLDGSDGGTAIFNNDLKLQSDSSSILFGTDGDVILRHRHDSGLDILMSNAGSSDPAIRLINSDSGVYPGAVLQFVSETVSPAVGDRIARISFNGKNSLSLSQVYGAIDIETSNVTYGDSAGKIIHKVATNGDNSLNSALELYGNPSGDIVTSIPAHDGASSGLMLGTTLVTATASEINLLDSQTSVDNTVTIEGTDGIIINDNGVMKLVPASAIESYTSSEIFSTISGDVTATAGGVLTIENNAVETLMVNKNVITGQTEKTSIHNDDTVIVSDSQDTGNLKKVKRSTFVSRTFETKNSSFTASINYHYSVSTSSNAVVATLPQISNTDSGDILVVKFRSGTNSLTVQPHSGDTIEGLSNIILTDSSAPGQSLTLVSDGLSSWEVI